MNDSVSIAVTVLGILLELLALIGLARLIDAELPILTILVFAAASILTIVIVIAGLIWGIEPLLVGCLLFALVLTTSLAASGIWALLRWLNRRDDPHYAKLPFNPP